MLKNNRAGKVLGVGYGPVSFVDARAQPQLAAGSSDFRPAYLNAIHIRIGGFDARNGRAALAGTNVVTNEPPARPRRCASPPKDHPSQLAFSPGAGDHYIGAQQQVGPVRRTSTCARRSGRR